MRKSGGKRKNICAADKTADILKTLNKKERDLFVSDLAQKDGKVAHIMASCFKDWADVLVLSEGKLKQLLKYIDKKVYKTLKADAEKMEGGYYFFVTDLTGKYWYAQTYAQHLVNCDKAWAVNASLKK